MECQLDTIFIFAFNRGDTVTEAAREICALYGESSISQSITIRLFSRFGMRILISRTDHISVEPLSLMKCDWMNVSTKINVSRPENWRNKLMDCDEKSVLTYFTQWKRFRNSALGCHTLWMKTTKINAQQSPPVYLLNIAQDMVTNSVYFTALSLAMKSGAVTSVWSIKWLSHPPKNKRLPEQKKTFILERPRCVYGATGKA